MDPSRPIFRSSTLALLVLAAPFSMNASAQPSTATQEAQARCERAVRDALAPEARTAAEVRFAALPAPQRPPSGESQSQLQGEGQWRDAGALRSFRFSCNLDPASAESVAVVIRQTSAPPADPGPALEPDLSHLSPAACESGAAQALKQRWPRVSQISFDTATRSLTQQSASRAELHGQGRALPAPDASAMVHFGFDCTLDPRDGRVLGLKLSG